MKTMMTKRRKRMSEIYRTLYAAPEAVTPGGSREASE